VKDQRKKINKKYICQNIIQNIIEIDCFSLVFLIRIQFSSFYGTITRSIPSPPAPFRKMAIISAAATLLLLLVLLKPVDGVVEAKGEEGAVSVRI
jgi:hypothetical protein